MSRKFIDVGSQKRYPGNVLSNFYPHRFTFQGKVCESMEGFLQAHKFEAEKEQRAICALVGKAAKDAARHRTKIWQAKQTLWWVDATKPFPRYNHVFPRASTEYFDHLMQAYEAMFMQCPDFRRALKHAEDVPFKHSIGHNDQTKTILTSTELITILDHLRNTLLARKNPATKAETQT